MNAITAALEAALGFARSRGFVGDHGEYTDKEAFDVEMKVESALRLAERQAAVVVAAQRYREAWLAITPESRVQPRHADDARAALFAALAAMDATDRRPDS